MQTISSKARLMSLLMVYLSENYESTIHHCDACGSITPSFGKAFRINGIWVCIDCISQRIEGRGFRAPPNWELPVAEYKAQK